MLLMLVWLMLLPMIFRQFVLFLADVIAILSLIFATCFCLADVIAMLLGYMMDGSVNIRLML